ncbi:MAG: aminotransferase class I/II-fold pyridoxal phosphate-dependent enzyme [Alphaproteobacteria bacterium]|nr:aminotransferase class I/II-fold pyridoxal phosphate-dependent enzyme [Alphaproteobacteria bacterium]
MDYVPHPAPDGPRYLALADAIVRDIREGRLRPGTPLPGTRELARRVDLHRNTVIRAYAELTAQGWTVAYQGAGTSVAPELPARPAPPSMPSELAGFRLPARGPRHLPTDDDARFRFMAGQPDLRLLPLAALSRAYRRALRGPGRKLVDYGDPQGSPRLRASLAGWLAAQRSLSVTPERLLVTRGSQQALYLAAHTLFEPGDRVAVEAYGYPPAWEALRTAGVEIVPVPVDADGMDVAALAGIPRLRGVYVTPHHQYPTGAVLSAARREALLALARDGRFPILEDDYDHEFHWHGHPIAPLAARDRHGVVVYIGTLSKAFAPGLRLGWVAAPLALVSRMTSLRRIVDRQGDRVVEHAVAELIDDGELQRHIRRMHRAYRERRQALRDAIASDLPDLVPNDPPGGLGLWCEAPGIDVQRWSVEARRDDVLFQPAGYFRMDRTAPSALRLGFPAHTPDELREGVARLAGSLARIRDRFLVAPSWSARQPGTSSETVRLRTAEGDCVQKRYRSPRAFQQAREALRRADPGRILAEGDRELLLRWIPGQTGSLDPAAHRAAGRWLRTWQEPVDDADIPLADAFAKRIAAARAAVGVLGVEVDLDPALFAGPRVWCHRDFRPENWVWSPPALHVIDFEHSRPDHPLVDLVKLATEVWPAHPALEAAFTEGYGAFDRAVLDGLIRLHGASTLAWAERHGDEAFRQLGRRILGL